MIKNNSEPIKKQVACFFTALRFLTIIPLSWFAEKDNEHFKDSVKYFVIVGLLIGILGALLCKIASFFFPHLILCVSAILYLAVISGFLHLDGLADTADGFFSARPKTKILEIMHDSRSGAMGVIVLIILILSKFAAFASLSVDDMFVAMFFMPIAGRCSIVLTMAFLPYAREEGGLGKLFYSDKGWAIPTLALVIFFLSGSFVSLYLTLYVFITVVATITLFGLWCKKLIGGTTGDTLGALCEITETGVVIILACV